VITAKVEDCYILLGLIHSRWTYYPEEFDDYIINPKPSGYKSIHTVVEYDGSSIEVQLRTQEMHEYNEFGPASHIAYKLQQIKGKSLPGSSYTWTKDLVEWQQKKQLTKEDFQVQAFTESIFVFTPKGEVIQLDQGATPLDFAFAIHSDLGYRFRGALVNKKMRAMGYQLQTGDIVEILDGPQPNVNRDWLKYAKMNSSRYKIRKWLNQRADVKFQH
jgi:GTP pyrophosphokinase